MHSLSSADSISVASATLGRDDREAGEVEFLVVGPGAQQQNGRGRSGTHAAAQLGVGASREVGAGPGEHVDCVVDGDLGPSVMSCRVRSADPR